MVVWDDLFELKVDKVVGVEGALFLLGLDVLGAAAEEEVATSGEGTEGEEGIGDDGAALRGGCGGKGPAEGRLCGIRLEAIEKI
jgi:hypothetical protein